MINDRWPGAEGRGPRAEGRGSKAEGRVLDDDGVISSCVMFHGSFVQSKNFVAL